MDHSIRAIGKVIHIKASGNERVDQHSTSNCKPGAYDVAAQLTTNELFMTLSKRLKDSRDCLNDVDRYFLFDAWSALDSHITEESQREPAETLILENDYPHRYDYLIAEEDNSVDGNDVNWDMKELFRTCNDNDIYEMENDDF